METLQQSQEHELNHKEFHALYDGVVEATWDLRIQDEYFDTYEKLSTKCPTLSQSELEAAITKNTAKEYANNLQFDPLKKAAFLLFAAAPDYAIHGANLQNQDSNPLAKKAVSEFNGLLRNFVSMHPEADRDQLCSRLVEHISTSNIDNGFKSIADLSETMQIVLGGIRTEVGFEQLLAYADIPFQRASTEQDLKSIDYLIPYSNKVMKIDFKSNVESTGHDNLPYARLGENHYRLLRLFGPADFKSDSFKLREESMLNKKEVTRELIAKLSEIG